MKKHLGMPNVQLSHHTQSPYEHTMKKQDALLFQSQMQGVTPLPTSDRKVHTSTPPPPVARQAVVDDDHTALGTALSDNMDVAHFLDHNAPSSYRQNGVGPDTLKRLRKGQWAIQARLDLHGYNTDEARQAVSEFIHHCKQNAIRHVCIIHGKGLSSESKQPVLKEKVIRWLVQTHDVLAFCQASPRDGGSGALLLILKSTSSHQTET